MNERILNYASPTRRPRTPWPWLIAVAGAIGVAYWSVADFWAYAGSGPTATPKFEMPLWWQVLESSFVGVGVTAGLCLAVRGVRRLSRPRTTRSSNVGSRLFSIFAALSAVALSLVLAALLSANSIDPRRHFISLTSGCHVSLDARGADARLEVFNDSSYGPYSGSIIGIGGDPNNPKVWGVGDLAGIYCRVIRRPDGRLLWTLSLSLMYPLVATAAMPAVWAIRRSRHQRRVFCVESQLKAV